jgi:hypothetical protein
VVVVVAALAIPVLSLWWAAAESPSAPISRRGVHNGVPYRIEAPAGWNGKLVVFAHGYEGEGSGQGSVHTSPLATYLTRQGYAWAASGYRSRGIRPDWFVADTLAVRELFIRDIGPPHWTIIHGMSMGGHVAIASLELYPGVYQGALIECGVIDGVSIGDLYVAWWAAAEYLSGGQSVGGAGSAGAGAARARAVAAADGLAGSLYRAWPALRQRREIPDGWRPAAPAPGSGATLPSQPRVLAGGRREPPPVSRRQHAPYPLPHRSQARGDGRGVERADLP